MEALTRTIQATEEGPYSPLPGGRPTPLDRQGVKSRLGLYGYQSRGSQEVSLWFLCLGLSDPFCPRSFPR